MSGIFINISWTVCRRKVLRGELFGSAALTARFGSAIDLATARAVLEAFDNPDTLARAEFWQSDEPKTPAVREEEVIHGAGRKVSVCPMFEFLRGDVAEAAAKRLAQRFGMAETGVYRLFCERS